MSTGSHILFSRTQLLVGRDAMARLAAVRVILLGLGGVGSWCAEALVRSGIRRLTLVDGDKVCGTNVNRQLQAMPATIGQPKADLLRDRLLAIAPGAEIEAVQMLYDATTCERFDLGSYDYVLDAIDTLKNKVLLVERTLQAGATLFASMGAGAKFDPTQIRTAPLEQSRHCPLARMVRKRLRHRKVPCAFWCVYSEELPSENRGRTLCGTAACTCPPGDEENLCLAKARLNGTLVHVTGAFGFALAGLVIQDVVHRAWTGRGDIAEPVSEVPSLAAAAGRRCGG